MPDLLVIRHEPVWYGDRWECCCGFTTKHDVDAFNHAGRVEQSFVHRAPA